MMASEIYEEQRAHKRGAKKTVDWFVGTYARAVEIMKVINDTRSVLTQFWTADFFDREAEKCFLLVWPNARLVEDPDGRSVWIVPDIVALEFLRSRDGGVILIECVEIEFASRAMREKFLAQTDHSLPVGEVRREAPIFGD